MSTVIVPRLPLVAGLSLCAYALYVEYRHAIEDPDADDHFQSLCDIDAINISCSKVFALPQGRLLSYFGLVPKESLLDIPNPALGFAHYTLMLLFKDTASLQPFIQLLVVTSFATTVYLAYQLTFVVPELCILCWSTHVINAYVLYRYFYNTSNTSKTMNKAKKV